VRLWARTGTDYTTCLDRIRAAVAALPFGAAVIHGEAVAFNAEGRPSFTALQSRESERHAVMVAYDLLEIDG
jgi:bifunctional non-homologous end joining protein LigD